MFDQTALARLCQGLVRLSDGQPAAGHRRAIQGKPALEDLTVSVACPNGFLSAREGFRVLGWNSFHGNLGQESAVLRELGQR